MNEFKLETLVFNDNDKVRTFFSSDFNFILDKEKKFSIAYGTNPENTPSYDPLSPEEVDIYVDSTFNFNKEFDNLCKLFNLNSDKNISISTISVANVIINDIYEEPFKDIDILIKYLLGFGIAVNVKINYNQINGIGDVFRLKVLDIENLILNVEEFKSQECLDKLNNILSKNINVSCIFNLSNKNYENFCELISLNFPINTFSQIIFKRQISKKAKKTIIDMIKGRGTFIICDTKQIKNDLDYKPIKKYQDGLFKCYINFINQKVFYSSEMTKGIEFSKIENINSYWNSDLFKKYRYSLISDKYDEDDEIEIESNLNDNEEKA